jgi:hypothetical protein
MHSKQIQCTCPLVSICVIKAWDVEERHIEHNRARRRHARSACGSRKAFGEGQIARYVEPSNSATPHCSQSLVEPWNHGPRAYPAQASCTLLRNAGLAQLAHRLPALQTSSSLSTLDQYELCGRLFLHSMIISASRLKWH